MNFRSRLRNGARLGAPSLAVLLACGACVFGSQTSEGPRHAVNGTEAKWLPPGDPGRDILTAFGWQRDESPLYTDDQRLHKSEMTFGAYVWIAPSVHLDTMSAFGVGADGVLVALLYVVPDTAGVALPQTYMDLHLSEGLNCIYLHRARAAATGFVRKSDVAKPYCPGSYSNATPINVAVVKSEAFRNPTDIPAVARFHEGANAQLEMDNAPYFGLKCFDAWCTFLPANVTPLDPPQSRNGGDKFHKVNGWSDAQHVAMPSDNHSSLTAPTTPRPLKSDDMVSWIVPDPNLSSWHKADYLADYRHVATVQFANGPKDKYESRWHFGPHTENHIYIKALDLATKQWTGYLIRRTYVLGIPMPFRRQFPLTVYRDDHNGMVVPPTARFRWNPLDEDIWVMCDDGCCKVSDGYTDES